MNIETAVSIVRMFFISIYTYEIYVRILEHKFSTKKTIAIIVILIILNFAYTIVKEYFGTTIGMILLYFLLGCCMGLIENVEFGYSTITMLIAFAMSVLTYAISVSLIYILHSRSNVVISAIFIVIIQKLLILLFFKIKRFKNGFSFLKNRTNDGYVDMLMATISVIVVFVYALFGSHNLEIIKHIFIPFIMLAIIMIIMIQKTLTMYYKQRLLQKTIEEYKKNIAEKDEQIKRLSEEKFKISKLNHEFYNRQHAMELKVEEFISNANLNTEVANELSVKDKINTLSKEYSAKLKEIKNLDRLPSTEVEEIDDMFRYMQTECEKNDIDFKLQVSGNIVHMTNKIIPSNKLATLIGDHIRDAIIAINSGNNNFRSILAILGIKDNCYEFCVYDTGIEFEIHTLIKLGVEPVTTHKDSGGTGVGFMTTFETLKQTNASLIIEEKNEAKENNYTKAVIIRFDNKNEYRICSYRADKIKEEDKSGRIIIKNI